MIRPDRSTLPIAGSIVTLSVFLLSQVRRADCPGRIEGGSIRRSNSGARWIPADLSVESPEAAEGVPPVEGGNGGGLLEQSVVTMSRHESVSAIRNREAMDDDNVEYLRRKGLQLI